MPDQPRHKSRRRTPIQVEPLEGRALLARSRPLHCTSTAQLVVNASSIHVNQQQGFFTVTVSLKKGISIGLKGPQPAAPLDQPLTVDFSASLEQPASGTTEAASPIFAPFHESVTFPAGASTETVTVPIISSAATAGPVTIYLSAAPTSSTSLGIPNGNGIVELYSSPDATPPTFTSVQLVTSRQARVSRRARLQQTDGNGDCGKHPQLSDLVAARDDPPHRFSLWAHRGMVDSQRHPLLPHRGGDLRSLDLDGHVDAEAARQGVKPVRDHQRVPIPRTFSHRFGGSAA